MSPPGASSGPRGSSARSDLRLGRSLPDLLAQRPPPGASERTRPRTDNRSAAPPQPAIRHRGRARTAITIPIWACLLYRQASSTRPTRPWRTRARTFAQRSRTTRRTRRSWTRQPRDDAARAELRNAGRSHARGCAHIESGSTDGVLRFAALLTGAGPTRAHTAFELA